jgi:hypothetical protein
MVCYQTCHLHRILDDYNLFKMDLDFMDGTKSMVISKFAAQAWDDLLIRDPAAIPEIHHLQDTRHYSTS